MSDVKSKKKSIPTVFWLPALLGAIAAFISWWAIENYIELKISERPRLPPLPVEELQVVVPRQPLAPGDIVSLEMLAARSLPTKALPTDIYLAEEVDDLMGQVVISDVAPGKPIQGVHLMEENSLILRERVRPGYTAFTLPLSAEWTHGLSVQAGDMFDLYEIQTGRWEKLLSNIELIDLAPQQPTTDRAAGIQQRATHGIFEVPVTAYAHIYTLQQQRLLVPVLQGIQYQPTPDFLSVPTSPEIILSTGPKDYFGEGNP